VRAQDLGGNLSRPVPGGDVRIRYLELTPERLVVAAQKPVRVVARTDARRIRWLLRRGSSVVDRGAAGRTIRFRAPQAPGRYILVVTAGTHDERATVVVRRAP
jgi:hypothetical protein